MKTRDKVQGIFRILLALESFQMRGQPLFFRTASVLAIGLLLSQFSAIAIAASPVRYAGSSSGNNVNVTNIAAGGGYIRLVNGQVIIGMVEMDLPGLFGGKIGSTDMKADIRIPIRSLKSGNPNIDQCIQAKTAEDKYPNIGYTPEKITVIKVVSGVSLEGELYGDLSMAGVTNKASVPVVITQLGDDKIKIVGNAKLSKKKFNIFVPETHAWSLSGAATETLALAFSRGVDDLFFPLRDAVDVYFEWKLARKL